MLKRSAKILFHCPYCSFTDENEAVVNQHIMKAGEPEPRWTGGEQFSSGASLLTIVTYTYGLHRRGFHEIKYQVKMKKGYILAEARKSTKTEAAIVAMIQRIEGETYYDSTATIGNRSIQIRILCVLRGKHETNASVDFVVCDIDRSTKPPLFVSEWFPLSIHVLQLLPHRESLRRLGHSFINELSKHIKQAAENADEAEIKAGRPPII